MSNAEVANHVLVSWFVIAGIFFAIGVWLGASVAFRSMSNVLVRRVRDLLNTDTKYPLNVESAVRELRTLVAVDGHRLPKHVRDAAHVWLAEREAAS